MLRLARGRRIVFYDRRGTGLSDPLDGAPTLEGQALDLEAVIDRAGVERCVLYGIAGSCAIAAYFAATRPDRVDRLILFSPWSQDWFSDDNGWLPEERAVVVEKLETALDRWGEGLLLEVAAPRLNTPRNRRLFGMLERASASRALARAAFGAAIRTDITSVLPAIQAPTLVLRHVDTQVPAAVVAKVAELIPEATLSEVDYAGEPHAMADFWMPANAEVDAWLTGATPGERVNTTFATLLFTDIVGSTELAARLGDAEWRSLLLRHDDLLRDLVDQEGGRLVKTIGDGSLTTFDGPVGAIRCADRLGKALDPLGLRLRAGIHSGECERVGLDFAGIAVHVAARVQAQADPGEILLTAASVDICQGSGFEFSGRGRAALKGVPGEWELFAVGAATDGVQLAAEPRLRPADRALLATARRAPGVLRAASRLRLSRRR
jgi:class 3 adenylate cyclase